MNVRYPTARYVWLTCKHKWFVFLAGLKTRTPLWQLIIHDWSKFTPSEAPHYGRRFFGDKGDPLGFSYAWNNHQKKNKHHWEYWIPFGSDPLPMPEKYVREMVADWLGASRAYEGRWPSDRNSWAWLRDKYGTLRLHHKTREMADAILDEVFTR